MKDSHERDLAKLVAKDFRRNFGDHWKASRLMSEKVMESMVAAGVMAIIITQEDSIAYRKGDMGDRSLYATIYREACKILLPWWQEETKG
jgi:hypothetical protein